MINIVRKILKVFDDNKLWEDGIELIGSWCFHLYQKHFGAKFYPLRTQDIDFLIPFPYKGKANIDLVKELEKLNFRYSFRPDGSIYLWNADLKIEFIVPERGEGSDRGISINQLYLKAIPLRFVNILLQYPVFVKEKGVRILVPDPAAFCLHKFLISSRRRKYESRLKDLEQAIYTYKIARRDKIKKVYIELHKRWRGKLLRNLESAKEDLPLLKDDIDKIIVTLQNIV